MRVRLRDENGVVEAFVDTGPHLMRAVRARTQDGRLLRYIDAYTDTIFNGLQMGDLLADWSILIAAASSQEEADVLLRVRELAVRCRDDVHTFLEFLGD